MSDRKDQTVELDADQLDAVQGGRGSEADLKIQSERDLAEKLKLSEYSGKTNRDKNAESIILYEEDVSL